MAKPSKWPDCTEAEFLNGQGYGRARQNGKTVLKHRLSYCASKGIELEDIKGMVVRHICDNPACYNPAHLEIGTMKDNSRDMVERGRAFYWVGMRNGEDNPKAKLTAKDVTEIRTRYVKRSKENNLCAIAKDYGVHFHTVRDAILRKTWK